MTKIKLIIGFVWFLALSTLIISILFYEEPINNYYKCKELKKFEKQKINCVVKDKYMDYKNHANTTLFFKNCQDMVVTYYNSKIYDFISKNDSIVKRINTDTIEVYRKGKVFYFKINFDCSE